MTSFPVKKRSAYLKAWQLNPAQTSSRSEGGFQFNDVPSQRHLLKKRRKDSGRARLNFAQQRGFMPRSIRTGLETADTCKLSWDSHFRLRRDWQFPGYPDGEACRFGTAKTTFDRLRHPCPVADVDDNVAFCHVCMTACERIFNLRRRFSQDVAKRMDSQGTVRDPACANCLWLFPRLPVSRPRRCLHCQGDVFSSFCLPSGTRGAPWRGTLGSAPLGAISSRPEGH